MQPPSEPLDLLTAPGIAEIDELRKLLEGRLHRMGPMEKLPPKVVAAAKKLAYDLIRSTGELPVQAPEFRHAPVLPERAQYSPWLTDPAFQQSFALIREKTLVDQFRCYELWQLVQQTAKLAPGAFIEVGVWRGGTGCLIAAAARHGGIQETVYLCDTFEGVVKAGAMDPVYRGGEHSDTNEETVVNLAERMNLPSVRILKGIFPDATASAVRESSIRLARLDVDVYESTKDIMAWVWPLLVPGGMAVFDDYGTYNCEGVTRIVNELSQQEDALFFHNLNGHGILVKR